MPARSSCCAVLFAVCAVLLDSTCAATDITATAYPLFDEADAPLDDSEWQSAAVAVLAQRSPNPGAPTDFPTTARFLVSRTHLYVRVDCTDADRPAAVAHSLVFDGDQSFDDHVVLVLDTFDRQRTAYEFDVNIAGARSDGLTSPAAQKTSYDWNGDWRARVVATSDGWRAYIAIDVRSLQFDHSEPAWGMNIARYVPRAQLALQWAGISLDASATDLSRAGTLSGMQDLDAASGWDISPYALARFSNRGGAQIGADVRYAVSPETTVIATLNPDFAEAQVDAQQINLTPYTLFKPEKRAFFLEGSNQFTFASGIGSIFIPFYSRSIGLVDGTPIRIDDGIKLVGQEGPWSFGALGVHAADSAVSDPTDLFVGRLAYDANEHLRVGALLTDGDPSGRTRNRFGGVDGVWRTASFLGDKNLNVSAWAARSGGDAISGDHNGFGTYVDYPNDLWRWVISANQFGDALNPAMGFLPRPGTRQYDFYLGHFPRPQSERWNWVRQFFYESELEKTDDLHGNAESRTLTLTPLNVITESAVHLEVHGAFHEERLTEPFAITEHVTLPVGDYHFSRMHFQAESSSSAALQAGVQVETGGFYDGTLIQAIPYVRWTTPNERWHFELNNETDRASLPRGRFIQRLHQLKASYSFNNDLAFSTFSQYDTDSGHAGVNAQLRWIIAPGREAFVVYNHAVAPPLMSSPSAPAPLENSLTIKLQWNFYL